jgi:hypothetical protein
MQVSSKMEPISAIATGALTAIKGLQTSKIQQAQSGKTFTPPKTALGKIIGSISGRTQAALLSSDMKKESITNSALRSSVPVSGALQFGGEARKNAWLPFAVVAAVALYFITGRRRKKRR